MKKILHVLLLLASLLGLNAQAQEQILSFHSAIDIQPDGALLVNESIEVRADGRQIRHGIYRDFPTRYRDRLGNNYRTGFKLIGVWRNGETEPHVIKPLSNGVRIQIGDANTLLAPGIYQYEIAYQTDRQLGFFEDFDELYFNVTGNGWAFPILRASATVSLPGGVDSSQVKLTGYTGVQGSSEKNLRHSMTPNSDFYFETTRPLQPREGLTIVAGWPKGIINAPDAEQLQQQFIDDNRANLIIAVGVLLVFIYYLLVWLKVGKDPQAGAIYPLYRAPKGFSPASMRFIRRMKYDKSCFTAALINLAVKGIIEIDQNESQQFVLRRGSATLVDLAPGEAAIFDALLGDNDEIILSQSQQRKLSAAIKQHEQSLREDFQQMYFNTNKKFVLPGLLASAAFIIWSLTEVRGEETIFASVFIGIFTLFPVFILLQLKKSLHRKNKRSVITQSLFQLAFLGAIIYIATNSFSSTITSVQSIAWPVVVGTLLLLMINLLFIEWIKAPTRAGRKLLDQIEGFELYLSVAEQDNIERSGEPAFNADIYQQFLPYAFALGIDHAWSKRLQRAIDEGLIKADYYPTGLLHTPGQNDINSLSDSLSSGLDAAISSASTTPGSSSGFIGGSSGGGGGGGGGGGW